MKSFMEFMVPELERLDKLEQWQANLDSMRTLGRRYWIPVAAGIMLYIAAIALSGNQSRLIVIAAGFFLPVPIFVVHRASIRRACWKILAARGEPICTGCGYDLTGNVSGRCPECGKETETESNAC